MRGLGPFAGPHRVATMRQLGAEVAAGFGLDPAARVAVRRMQALDVPHTGHGRERGHQIVGRCDRVEVDPGRGPQARGERALTAAE